MLSRLLKDSLEINDIWVNIKGSSMEPFLKNGSQALVRKTAVFRPGDILIYGQGQALISHRLIRRRRNIKGELLYQTKADNNPALDAPVRRDEIIGKIVAFKKNGSIVRLDNFLGLLSAFFLWFVSALDALLHKYVKISN